MAFFEVFWAFFGYFLSVNELQDTHFDPFVVKILSLELYQEISYGIFILTIFGGGLAYENLRQETLRPERSSAARRCALLTLYYPNI